MSILRGKMLRHSLAFFVFFVILRPKWYSAATNQIQRKINSYVRIATQEKISNSESKRPRANLSNNSPCAFVLSSYQFIPKSARRGRYSQRCSISRQDAAQKSPPCFVQAQSGSFQSIPAPELPESVASASRQWH